MTPRTGLGRSCWCWSAYLHDRSGSLDTADGRAKPVHPPTAGGLVPMLRLFAARQRLAGLSRVRHAGGEGGVTRWEKRHLRAAGEYLGDNPMAC